LGFGAEIQKKFSKIFNFFPSRVMLYSSTHIYICMKRYFKSSWFLARRGRRQTLKNVAEDESLNLTKDTFFKFAFSFNSEDSREALRSLLSACTRREVTDVQIINNDVNTLYQGAKQSRLDVCVTFNDGEAASLEMQACKTSDELGKRAEYYAVMLVAGQEAHGKTYRDIKRVYQIFFLNDVLYANSDKIPRRYYYQEEAEHDRLSNLTEIIFYELPKLEKLVAECLKKRKKTKFLTKEEKWCIYLRYRHEKRAKTLIERLCYEEVGIMKAEQTIYKVSPSYKEYIRKLGILKNNLDHNQAMLESREAGIAEGIEKGREEGREAGIAEGIEKGHEEGREAGIAEGIEKGREEEKNEYRLFVIDMLDKGFTPEEIRQRL